MSKYLHVDYCEEINFPHRHPVVPATTDMFRCEGRTRAELWDNWPNLCQMFDGILMFVISLVAMRWGSQHEIPGKIDFFISFVIVISAASGLAGLAVWFSGLLNYRENQSRK